MLPSASGSTSYNRREALSHEEPLLNEIYRELLAVEAALILALALLRQRRAADLLSITGSAVLR